MRIFDIIPLARELCVAFFDITPPARKYRGTSALQLIIPIYAFVP